MGRSDWDAGRPGLRGRAPRAHHADCSAAIFLFGVGRFLRRPTGVPEAVRPTSGGLGLSSVDQTWCLARRLTPLAKLRTSYANRAARMQGSQRPDSRTLE